MIKQANLSHEDMELLSTYLDGALSEKEKAHFEFRLQESVELQQALDAYRQLQWNLRHLPKPKLPHNFTLTRAEAQAVKRQKAWIPLFSTASFVSFLAMAVMFILPIFSPAASPVSQNMAMEPSLGAPVASTADQTRNAQPVPEAAPAESAPTEMALAPMADTSHSSEDRVDIFFFGGQVMGKGGGGGGDGSLESGGGGGLDANLYPIAQGPGNLGIFGNAPNGIVVPVEPLYGTHPGAVRGQDYDLEQVLAATPSLPPLILGMNIENAGQLIAAEPIIVASSEPAMETAAPAEVPQPSLEPGLAVETPAPTAQVPTRTTQSSSLLTVFKVVAGALALLFAGLALYFKKR